MSKILNSILESASSILERDIESIDFGVPDLNEIYKSLSREKRKKVHAIKDVVLQRQVLKHISNPKLDE